MKIACLAILDNGNAMRHIARGLRDYCNQDATCFHQMEDTYLHIPDSTVEKWTKDNFDTDDYDFIITNDHTYVQYHKVLREKPRLVKCNGTYARHMGPWLSWDAQKYGTTYLTSPCDYDLAMAVHPSIQTLGPLYDHRLLPEPNFSTDKIIVGHAPTNPHKGTATILELLQPYRKKKKITIDVIQNTPWHDCIQRKAKCHIFIDNATRPAFGINAIESLALGSIVLNKPLHPYIKHHFHYEIPIEDLTPATLEYHIKELKKNKLYLSHGYDTHFAELHFDIKVQAPKLIEWVTLILEPHQ